VSIDEVIEKRKEEILKDARRRIEMEVEASIGRVERALEDLKEASKITLPVNLVEILAKGGHVRAKDVEVGREAYVNLTLSEGWYDNIARDIVLQKGKYRVILIIEKIS